MSEIRITLETLYDMLRNEKKREDLQKLPDTFFVDIVQYLTEKQALLDSQSGKDELFALGEKQKLEYEIRSIQRILKQFYELREKKIIEIALNRSRTGSDIIDTSSLLFEEKQFYQKTLEIMDGFRRGILLQLLKRELPMILGPVFSAQLELRKVPIQVPSLISDSDTSSSENTSSPLFLPNSLSSPLGSSSSSSSPSLSSSISSASVPTSSTLVSPTFSNPAGALTKIHFIRSVPSFIWKDLKEYGPFAAGESTEIFPEVAELLIRKGRAERV